MLDILYVFPGFNELFCLLMQYIGSGSFLLSFIMAGILLIHIRKEDLYRSLDLAMD